MVIDFCRGINKKPIYWLSQLFAILRGYSLLAVLIIL